MVIKVIILDAGGVITPDSYLGSVNQIKLSTLTGLALDELNRYQNHITLNLGAQSLFEVFEQLARDSRLEPKPSADQLLSAYCEGIYLYPGARELIHDFYNT